MPVWYDAAEMIAAGPDIVIEAAGHEALRAVGPAAVASGADLIVAAVGALADEDFAAELREAARHGARVIVPPGAVAGLDGLVAARSAGLEAVTYSSYKPPHAWRGTRAEAVIDLDHERRRSSSSPAARARPRCTTRRTPMSGPRSRSPGSGSTRRGCG